MLRQLAHAKVRESPSFMRLPVALMWERHWTRILAVAFQCIRCVTGGASRTSDVVPHRGALTVDC